MPSARVHPPELAAGTVVAGCRVDGVAGRGGMSTVYRATQLGLGRPVALKVLAGDRALDPSFRERFALESRLAASIDHPNVVTIHAAGEEDGLLYLLMRYVSGTDVQALLAREGRLPPWRAAAIVAQVAEALDAAHAAGLVHRDVKPGNVLVAGEHAYLGDFGLTRPTASDAHITETGAWVGTVDYMSPEHLRGDRCDARSDVYALGCLLFTLLCGVPPFRRDAVPATAYAHAHEPPPRASERAAVPRELDAVIARALAKDPQARYPSAGDLGRAAVAAAAGELVTEAERTVAGGDAAPPPTEVRPPTTLWLPARPPTVLSARRRGRLGLVLAALAGLAAAAVVIVTGLIDAAPDLAASRRPAAPLTEGDVRSAASGFANAVAGEDATALSHVLARDVQRVFPTDVQKGRTAVTAAYRSQFRTNAITGYDLADLEVRAGRVGRASGRYTLRRVGRADVTGRLVLGVVRERGEPRVALIAATPD